MLRLAFTVLKRESVFFSQIRGGAEQRPLKLKDSLGDLRYIVSTCLTKTFFFFFFLKKLVAYFLKPFRLERIEIDK